MDSPLPSPTHPSLKPPTILAAVGLSGMILGTLSCAHANTFPGGSDGSTTYGLWGVFSFSIAALIFAAGALWLIIAAIARRSR